MPFEKGRKKTGGKVKGGSLKHSRRFVDQLQRYGLNVARELAHGVMAMQDPIARFNEVRRLLPYLVPELKPIDPVEDDLNNPEIPISTEDLLGALNNNGRKSEPARPSTDPIPVVEERSSDVETPNSPTGDSPEVDGDEG
jgi:hypothetical protein